MDRIVKKKDLSLVPEIRHLHQANFHSFRNDHKLSRDSTDLPIFIERESRSVPGILERIAGICKDNYKSVFITIIIVLVILLETALDGALFVCPCAREGENIGYSVIFLIGPAITLFIIGILGNNDTWRLVTGCWYRTKSGYHGCYRGLIFMADVLAKAMFTPFAWVTYGFIDGRFYVCMVSDDPCGTGNSTVGISADKARQDAQIIGYVMLMSGASVILMCVLFSRAFSRYSYEQDDYIRIYRTVERIEMQNALEETATEVAQRVVKAFLHKQSRDQSDWDMLTTGDTKRPSGGGLYPSTPMQRIYQREHIIVVPLISAWTTCAFPQQLHPASVWISDLFGVKTVDKNKLPDQKKVGPEISRKYTADTCSGPAATLQKGGGSNSSVNCHHPLSRGDFMAKTCSGLFLCRIAPVG